MTTRSKFLSSKSLDMKKKPRAIDLFSGCGGLSVGLRKAGYRVIYAVDADPLAIRAYRANHPRTKTFLGDIRDIAPRTLMKSLGLKFGELDLIAGCPPCQGFSTLRTLNGKRKVKEPMNDLVFDFLRFVKIMRPKSIMMENVPALADDWRLQRFCAAITKLGYKYEYTVANAREFGVPQRRRRMVLIASRIRQVSLPNPSRKVKTVRETIGDLPHPSKSRDPLHNYKPNIGDRVQLIINSLPKNGGSRSDLSSRLQLGCHKRSDGFRDVYGRMAWDEPAPTITGGCINPSKGRFIHPRQNRPITLREAAMLQGFPRQYKFPIDAGRYPVAKLIGNAFPPEFARRYAKRLLELNNAAESTGRRRG
jgi:DNA (cytosine-5)-methyltransferase 1